MVVIVIVVVVMVMVVHTHDRIGGRERAVYFMCHQPTSQQCGGDLVVVVARVRLFPIKPWYIYPPKHFASLGTSSPSFSSLPLLSPGVLPSFLSNTLMGLVFLNLFYFNPHKHVSPRLFAPLLSPKLLQHWLSSAGFILRLPGGKCQVKWLKV